MGAKIARNKKQLNTTSNDLFQQYTFWILGIFITGFFFISPFFKALFNGGTRSSLNAYVFNQPMYASMIVTFVAALIFGLLLFNRHNRNVFSQDLVPHILMWLIPFSYLLTYFISAASKIQTIHFIVIHCMYALFFMMAYYLSRSVKGLQLLSAVLMVSGYIIVIFGFMNWFGNASFWGLINYSSDPSYFRPTYINAVMQEPGRLRLTSVFQYANTYAAFLIALLSASIYLLIHVKQKWVRYGTSFMIVPIFISLFLTVSRGGLVMLPVVTFILLFTLRLHKQLLYLFYIIISGAVTLPVHDQILLIGTRQFEAFTTGNYLLGTAILAGISLLFVGFCYIVQEFVAPRLEQRFIKLDSAKMSRYYIPITGVLLGSLTAFMLLGTGLTKLLPDSIQQRVANISFDTHSVLERATFYRDSVKMVADYPLFGAGGGAWSLLFDKYQSNPYTVTQAHSFFIQYLIETGFFGFLILLVFMGYIYWRYLRTNVASESKRSYSMIFPIFTIGILVHSIIDFNMSYIFIGCLVFLCFGVMSGVSQQQDKVRQEKRKMWKPASWVIPAFVTLLSLVLLISSLRFQTSSNFYVKAVQNKESGNFSAIMNPLDEAIANFPHPDYLVYRAQVLLSVYDQTKDEQYAQEVLKTCEQLLSLEPYNAFAHEIKYQLYLKQDDILASVSVLESMIDNSPWNILLYERLISMYTILASDAEQVIDESKYMDKSLELHQEVLRRMELLKQLPENQLPGNFFGITPNIALNISQIYLYREQYVEASELLSQVLNVSTSNQIPQTEQILVRFYLASLILQNRNDNELYNAFIKQYPDEEAEIKSLVNMFS